ncbi:MAG TPA: glycosyltransferase, partial [Xanthomarina gelatinilytica]|nr:glycosyltransferase [Xanthomarina gelatinilytica]
MSKLPLVSIITVVYNGAKTLEQTILSVLNQTYKNIEYIIIDGESTDGTLDIIEMYRDKISTCISEPDEGLYDAMNKGVSIANGEL